jgi:DNA-binding beta-propeller fold protein YncE
VYVADAANHRIQKFSSDAVFVTEWGSFGDGAGQFGAPGAIAVDSDSEVFVGDAFQRIQVFSSDGAYLRQWSLAAGGDSPRGLAIGSDGTVYVMSGARERVLKFSNEGALQGFWGSPGFDDGEFHDPRDIDLDSQNNVYVADADRIQKFTSDGVFLLKWTGLGEGVRCIATDLADNIYVTDFKFAKVKKFTCNGVYLTEWGSYGVDDGEFGSVNGIATGPGREIYVGDTSLHRIQKFACPFVAVEPESWGQIKDRYRTTRR